MPCPDHCPRQQRLRAIAESLNVPAFIRYNTKLEYLWNSIPEKEQYMWLQAQDPTTSPEQLEVLYKQTDDWLNDTPAHYGLATAMRNAMASNPNISAELAVRIAGARPEEVLSNPAFSLWMVENPGFLTKLPHWVQQKAITRFNLEIGPVTKRYTFRELEPNSNLGSLRRIDVHASGIITVHHWGQIPKHYFSLEDAAKAAKITNIPRIADSYDAAEYGW